MQLERRTDDFFTWSGIEPTEKTLLSWFLAIALDSLLGCGGGESTPHVPSDFMALTFVCVDKACIVELVQDSWSFERPGAP